MMKQVENSFEDLNFTGNESSWFDLWHTHTDWDGKGNHSWKRRSASLEELISLYNHFREKLESYPNPYQLWIEIWENDSSEDAIYIHTTNPNSDNFPIKVKAEVEPVLLDLKLKAWIESQPFEKLTRRMQDDTVIYLFDKKVGMSLES